MSSSTIDAGVITPEMPNTPPPSPQDDGAIVVGVEDIAAVAVSEAVAVVKDVLPDCLDAVIDKVVADISEIPEVAAILRHVPKFVAAAHTLTVPGPEKRTLVLKALHVLVEKLQAANKISAEFRGELDAFLDATVPVSIDTLLDVVKGRVTFDSLIQQAAANPEAVVAVAATALTCCTGLFKTLIKKKVVAAPAAPAATVEPVENPTPA
jgi:hypothetical protein